MKLATFEADGTPRFGVVVDGGVAEASGWLPDQSTLHDALRDNRLPELQELMAAKPDHRFDEVRLLPPILHPRRIICIGLNYDAHRQETGRNKTSDPTIFVRWPSSVVGHESALVRPSVSHRFDYEGELAVVIGRAGRRIPADRALEHVAGYACFNDGSIRDYQRHTSQFTPGKNFDRSGGFGPWLVTADEIPDPGALELTTRLNGEVVQHAPTSQLIFSVPRLIEYISTFTTLDAGDVIATGTPSGVGDKRTPPLYMKPGDRVEVEISGIGILAHPVIGED